MSGQERGGGEIYEKQGSKKTGEGGLPFSLWSGGGGGKKPCASSGGLQNPKKSSGGCRYETPQRDYLAVDLSSEETFPKQ